MFVRFIIRYFSTYCLTSNAMFMQAPTYLPPLSSNDITAACARIERRVDCPSTAVDGGWREDSRLVASLCNGIRGDASHQSKPEERIAWTERSRSSPAAYLTPVRSLFFSRMQRRSPDSFVPAKCVAPWLELQLAEVSASGRIKVHDHLRNFADRLRY